jgi:hypothetical protein
MKQGAPLTFAAIVMLGLGACGGSPDTTVCNELPDPALCKPGTTPLQKVPEGADCVNEAQGPCGGLYIALIKCGILSPTCVDKSGISDPNTLQSCDAEQTAWDHCINPQNH